MNQTTREILERELRNAERVVQCYKDSIRDTEASLKEDRTMLQKKEEWVADIKETLRKANEQGW